MKKTVLITGCSSGLGLAAAVLFAHRGYRVYATMRNLAKRGALEQAAGPELTGRDGALQVRQLDVTDAASVDRCVSGVLEETGRIDVLINNAGAGFARTTEQTSEEELHWLMDVNYFGTVRCCRAVLPGMRERGSGHIVNVSSVGGLVGQPFNELYCATKFAVEGYTEGLASYLTEGFGLRFTAVEPGGMRSAFFDSATAATLTDGKMDAGPYQPLLQRYLGGSARRAETGETGVFQTPEEVAAVLLGVVTADDPPVRIRTSEWAERLCRLKTQADPMGRKQRDRVVEMFL